LRYNVVFSTPASSAPAADFRRWRQHIEDCLPLDLIQVTWFVFRARVQLEGQVLRLDHRPVTHFHRALDVVAGRAPPEKTVFARVK
jgi:hypothetical protein